MALDDMYRVRYRRRQRRRMLAIVGILMLVAVMLVAVRACSDHINEDMKQGYNPLEEQAQKYFEQKLKDKFKEQFKDQLNQLGR